MSKSEYRSFFAICRPFIKFNFYLKQLHISAATFSRFMNYEDGRYDGFISIVRLDELYQQVYNSCSAIVDIVDRKVA